VRGSASGWKGERDFFSSSFFLVVENINISYSGYKI
jgi:hypothetical protein